jgi:hypothetical protein
VRASFLSDCGWGRSSTILSSLERRDQQLRRALGDGRHVVLWFEHDLYDQLQLLDVLALAHDIGGSVEAIVVDTFPGKPSFRGLGELSAEELERLWPERRLVTAETLATAAAAWDAFRAPEPSAVTDLAGRQFKGLPFLPAALRRLLEELPAPVDGLSGTERRALRGVADGAHTPPAAFLVAQELEDAPFQGDAWFYRVLSGLGQGPARLLETNEGEALPAPPPLTDGRDFTRLPLQLTELGERVLQSEADRVELLGIDRWIGGTFVTPATVWRWDPAEQSLVT